jgi:thiamine biosynthesis lipoprotein ApbE
MQREDDKMAMQTTPTQRISDLPREQRLSALYRRAAAERQRFEATRNRQGWLSRLRSRLA